MTGTNLWVITAYFNPAGSRRRLINYREFRRRLRAPLVTVELSFNGEFELRRDDADILVQLKGAHILWQKERLLNIAWAHVPPSCQKIAWIDADVFFECDDWVGMAVARLDRVPMIMLFSHVAELKRHARVDIPLSPADYDLGHSLFERWRTGHVAPDVLRANHRLARIHTGMAWAARREVIDGLGFYDACIVGSGNRAIVCAALGKFDDAIAYLRMDARWTRHYLAWAEPFHSRVQGRLAGLDVTAFHLWHGALARRRYAERHHELARYGFDPDHDIGLGTGGCWMWTSEKPAMHEFVRRYFDERKEDG